VVTVEQYGSLSLV
jgi:hypothetical protein